MSDIREVVRTWLKRHDYASGPEWQVQNLLSDIRAEFPDAVLAVRDAEVERLRADKREWITKAEELLDRAKAAEARLAAVEALADEWDDFEHDLVTCPKFSCPDCTMKNATFDLRKALADHAPDAGGRARMSNGSLAGGAAVAQTDREPACEHGITLSDLCARVERRVNEPAPDAGDLRDSRDPKPCPRCGQICAYDGWDLTHPNGIGIGSCAGDREPAGGAE